jgi:hypothetical protein
MTMAAVRVSLSWLGVRKTVTPEHKNEAADTFGATGDFFSAGKKLLDTKPPSFNAVPDGSRRRFRFHPILGLPFLGHESLTAR